jgi:threonine dehydrogenase-like Zn-dependent dehydrogenase
VRLGIDVHGAFAEYVRVPQRFVWPLPPELPDTIAALTEPLAVAVHGHKKGQPAEGERVLVYGTGVIGLLSLQLAVLAGAEVTAFDIVEPRLDIARRLGARRIIQSLSDLDKEGGSFSLVYEISGVPGALSETVKLCAPGGRVVLTGLPDREFPVLTTPIVRKELTIMGSMIYENEFPEAIGLLRDRKIDVQPLISGSCPLEKLQEALEGFRSPNRVKTLIHIS